MCFFLSMLCPSLPSSLVHLYLCLPIFSLRCSSSFFSFCSSPFTPHAKDCELDARTCAPTHPHTPTRTHTRNSPVRFFIWNAQPLFSNGWKVHFNPLLVSNRLRFSDPMPPKLFRRTKFCRKISELGQVTPWHGGRLFKSCSFLCIKVLTLLWRS